MDAESEQVEALKSRVTSLEAVLEAVDGSGRASSFLDHLKAREATIAELDQLLSDLIDFVSSCRWAGPDGIETLRAEAWKLYQRLMERKP